MKRWGLLFLGVLLFSGVASAQEAPKLEVFAGYSYLFTVVGTGIKNTNSNGGKADAEFSLNNWFSVAGDFGGYYSSNFAGSKQSNTLLTFLGGPRFSLRSGKARLFGEGLFGGAHDSVSTFSANAFSFAVGGGADVNLSEHFGIRVVEADYLYTKFNLVPFFGPNNTKQNSARISTGVVIRF